MSEMVEANGLIWEYAHYIQCLCCDDEQFRRIARGRGDPYVGACQRLISVRQGDPRPKFGWSALAGFRATYVILPCHRWSSMTEAEEPDGIRLRQSSCPE